jgi:hypothetical protein
VRLAKRKEIKVGGDMAGLTPSTGRMPNRRKADQAWILAPTSIKAPHSRLLAWSTAPWELATLSDEMPVAIG